MPPKFHRRFAPARFARARFARDLYWIILFIPVTVVFPGWMQFTVSDSATAHDHEPSGGTTHAAGLAPPTSSWPDLTPAPPVGTRHAGG